MSYASSSSVTKLQYAQFLSASIAYLLNRQQDAVGLVAFDQKVHTHVPARNRTGHMRTIFGHLSRLEAGGETKLSTSLHQLAEILTRRGIVVIISDFYDEPDRLKEAFQHLRFKGHDLVAFHVLDQNKLDFSFDEPVLLLEDAETLEQMPVLPDVVMNGYRERMRRHVRNEECRGKSRRLRMLTTKQPLTCAVVFVASERKIMSRKFNRLRQIFRSEGTLSPKQPEPQCLVIATGSLLT
jgi:uncharacterized protein (DUF58 family)